MKKINLIVISQNYPNSVFYKSGIFVEKQVKELLKKDINIIVIAPIPFSFRLLNIFNLKWKNYYNTPKEELLDNIQIYHPRFIAIPGGKLIQYWSYIYYFSVKKIIKKILQKVNIDILHVHGTLPDDYGVYLLSKYFKIPYVLTVHGATVNELYKHKKYFKRSKVAIEKAGAVIGISQLVVNRIKILTKREQNLFTIYNGYDPNRNFSILKSHKTINILFVGNLIEKKGIFYLLNAFLKITDKQSDVLLTIVGGGACEKTINEIIDKSKIKDKIHLKGVLSHNDVLQEMSNCDIFILPSWSEGFGVVYLEAMSMRKPIIGTHGEGICDLVQDGKNGLLVKPRHVNSIIEKLSLLISDRELRIRIGDNGYDSIKNLTWENNALQNIKVYKKVLENLLD